MQVVTVEVPHLDDPCRLVHDGGVTPVVGPSRDLAAVERAAEATPHQPQEAFAVQLVEGFGPVPGHHVRMAGLDRAGAGRSPGRPAVPVTAEQVSDAVLRGSWVVDLRQRGDYARGHLAGTVNVGFSDQLATHVGWLVPWGDDIVLLTDTPEVLDEAVRQLADIGIDAVGAHVLDPAQPLPASYRVSDWAGFRAAGVTGVGDGRVVLDVRQPDEHLQGHLPGAVHLSVQDVDAGAAALPPGEVWVHCRSGYRAGIAASLLHRHGRSVVQVDDDWDRVAALGLTTTRTAAPAVEVGRPRAQASDPTHDWGVGA